MKWEKLGNIFKPDHNHSWMVSHASNTACEYVSDDIYRIYFSCRDANNIARVGFVDVDILKLTVLNISEDPVLDIGEVGAFDDNGISLACVIQDSNRTLMYYLGWNLAKNVPFRNAVGVAEKKGEIFKKIYTGPILDRCTVDPYSLSYPYVLKTGNSYKMWYGSHKQWGSTTDDMIHCMKYAESIDGENWKREGKICLDTDTVDYAFSRPFVIFENNIYKMWYSVRGGKYRIGYAESPDGITWNRMDNQVGITTTPESWDSEMIEYPYLFDHKGNRYMLYNGDGYGKTGFGIAVLKDL